MELILLKDVKALGKIGEIVQVKPGFARNYLLPTKKAARATAENKIEFENKKIEFSLENEKKLALANEIKESLANVEITIIRQAAEDGKLYGSVSARDILANLKSFHSELERENIMLDEPIKSLGEFDILVSLGPDINTNIKLFISRK